MIEINDRGRQRFVPAPRGEQTVMTENGAFVANQITGGKLLTSLPPEGLLFIATLNRILTHPYSRYTRAPRTRARYVNLVYLAARLLAEVSGDRSAMNYAGIRSGLRHKCAIDAFVAKFREVFDQAEDGIIIMMTTIPDEMQTLFDQLNG